MWSQTAVDTFEEWSTITVAVWGQEDLTWPLTDSDVLDKQLKLARIFSQF